MKRKKLTLNRETVRNLADQELHEAVGGTCTNGCNTRAANGCNFNTESPCVTEFDCLLTCRTCPVYAG